MTGDLTPDATGDYLYYAPINAKPAYRRVDGEWQINWDGPDDWIISRPPGIPAGDWWQRVDPNIEGEYLPQGTALGVATVTEI